jgi:hypothetical protein
MLTLSRVVLANHSRGAEITLWASQPNSGPGDVQRRAGRIHRSDRVSSRMIVVEGGLTS